MSSTIYDNETMRLIDAIPTPGDRHETQVPGECPLAYDNSGTRNDVFEGVAQDPEVARQLYLGGTSVDLQVAKRLGERVGLRDSIRISEYAGCLMRRASGLCAVYDAELRRDRTPEEALEFVRSQNV